MVFKNVQFQLHTLFLAGCCLALWGCQKTEMIAEPVCQTDQGPALMKLPGTSLFIHQTEITQTHFAAFVKKTNYKTLAERSDPSKPELALGAAVFQTPQLDRPNWWRLDRAANWRRPRGADDPTVSTLPRSDRPVVQIAYEDAKAYADWAKGRLPSLEEWRLAALGGQDWTEDTSAPDIANTWQGAFPLINLQEDGYQSLAPVGAFPPNDYGLYDMIGNAWEWTSTPSGPNQAWLAGGSFLCDVKFCNNGSPFGRQVQELDFSADHIGFRLVFDTLPDNCTSS